MDPEFTDIGVDVEASVQLPEPQQVPPVPEQPVELEPPVPPQPRLNRILIFLAALAILILAVVLPVIFYKPRRTTTKNLDMDCRLRFSVSKIGGGSDFKTISEAISASPSYFPSRICVLIRAGQYQETVNIGPDKTNVTLIGEGIGNTTIISNASTDGRIQAAMLRVLGKDFMVQDLTISNTARYGVAVDNWSEHSVFYRCKMDGENMTLHMNGAKQFYRDCSVYGGGTRLVSGDAYAFFQRCEFFGEKFDEEKEIIFSDQSREASTDNSGLIFHLCVFHSPKNVSGKVLIGSASGNAALIVVMQSSLDASFTGYATESFQSNLTYFGIFKNFGPGATRNSTPPYVHVLDYEEARSKFSLQRFLDGQTWIPAEVDQDLDVAT